MKKVKVLLTTGILALSISFTAFAGTWQAQENGQWKYQNDDGSYATGWVSDSGKGYYFDVNGIMLTSTITPDDFYVGADGASNRDFSINYDESTYQGVLDSYTAKLKAATPILVAEYNAESKSNTSGIYGLAELSTNKVYILAEIATNGTAKMAEILLYHSSGNNDEYMEWARKLDDVYMKEAEIIDDAYMKSVS